MAEATSATDSVQRLVEATIACVARAGYAGASTKEIAREAGVSKSLLHYHFASKEELLCRAAEDLFRGVAEAIKERVRERGPVADAVMRAADDLYDLLLKDPLRTAFLAEVWATAIYNERLRTLLERFQRRERRLIETTLAEVFGQAAERLIVPLERLAALVHTAIVGLSVRSALPSERRGLRQTFEDLKEVVIRGALGPGG